MYAAHLLWAIAQALMLHNWIAGFSLLVVTIPQYLFRVNAEEQMLLEQFGEQYKNYMQRTGVSSRASKKPLQSILLKRSR